MKIHIIGGPGSGKSFTSRHLAERYGIPVLDLDDIFWDHDEKVYGRKADPGKRDAALSDFLNRENWIVEGAYYRWLGPSFQSADWIFVLVPPLWIRQVRLVRRFLRRKLGIDPSKKETILGQMELMAWNRHYDQDNLMRARSMLADLSLSPISCRGLADVLRRLNEVGAQKPLTHPGIRQRTRKDMLLCLAYPELGPEDRGLIDEFRSTHDKAYVDVVEPHWTMIFPLWDLPQAQVAAHIGRVAKKFRPVDFACRYALVHDDDEREDYYIFLVPDEGFSQISRIHDDLYSGFLQPYLRLDLPYVPHIGIATNPDPRRLKIYADEWNRKGRSIAGRVTKLTLSQYDGKVVRDLEQFELTGSQPVGRINEAGYGQSLDSSGQSAKEKNSMTSEIIIRPATAGDGPSIFALVNQLHETISVYEARFSGAFPSILDEPNHGCFVIEWDAEVVGYASGYKHVSLAVSQPVAFLDEIVVKPELRGRGLGRRLMAAFEEWAGDHHCKVVALATGGAREFYERLGYSSRAGYYKKTLKAHD